MEKGTVGRKIRFFSAVKASLFLLLWISAAGLSQAADIQTAGFLAADYTLDQEDGPWPDGTFGHAMLGFSLYGQASDQIDYRGRAVFSQGRDFEIAEAWARAALSRYVIVRLGLYLVPFGQYNESSLPHMSNLVSRPLHAQYLYPDLWREVGIMAEGSWSGLDYCAWLGNGLAEGPTLADGQQFEDNNADKAWGFRAGMNLGQGTELAYSLTRSRPDSEASRFLTMHAVNLNWITSEIEVTAEYARAEQESPEAFEKAIGEGYLVQVIVHLGSLDPVLSYQTIDYTDGFRGAGFESGEIPGEGFDVDRTRWTLGAVLRLGSGVNLKLEYALNREPSPTVKDNRFTVQLAAGF